MRMQEHQPPAPEPKPEAAWRVRWRRRLRPAGLAGLLIAAALVGLWLYSYLFPPPTPLEARDVDRLVAAAMASATPPPANSALVDQGILPSLVFIQTTGANEAGEEGFGVCSGVVVNASSDILTAQHVVVDAREIEVSYADGTRATTTTSPVCQEP